MDNKGVTHALLGLDIGNINTRASYFEILQEKYQLSAFGIASSTLGHGLQPGSGAGAAMQNLQNQSEVHLLKPNGELIWPYYETGLGVDRIAVTISGGPQLKAVVLGVTQEGSMKVGRALVESLPLSLAGSFGLQALSDETGIIDTIAALQPEIVILSGGRNGGAERPIYRWVEVLALVCQILPKDVRLDVIYTGNALLEKSVKRHLEPLATLSVVPNIYPDHQESDLVPAQAALDKVILSRWQKSIPGFKDLVKRTNSFVGTKSFTLGRMARYLSEVNTKTQKGVLAVDLGGGSTTIAAGLNGESGTNHQPAWEGLPEGLDDDLAEYVRRWTAEPVTLAVVKNYLCNHALIPSFVPDDHQGLAISHAFARYRLHQANYRMLENFPWYPYHANVGLTGVFEPVIISGSIFSQAPTGGHSIMMILDGLQPLGVTTIVLDRYQILPLLGLIGAFEPVLPTHVLASNVFTSLGTVITAVADVPEDKLVLTVNVGIDNGKDYDVEILQGTLRRLVIPPDVTAELSLEPAVDTDIGFGGRGVGGRLKVPGGSMGVVIDARGRPLKLPEDDEMRIETLKRWLLLLGG